MTNSPNPSQFWQNLMSRVKKNTGNIWITAHLRPDYDSVCSSLAVQRLIRAHSPDKQATILFPDTHVESWDDLHTEGDIVWIGEQNREKLFDKEPIISLIDYLSPQDLLICLDGNTYGRFVPAENTFVQERLPFLQTIETCIIDHHEGTPDPATLTYIDTQRTSTCEIIARMAEPQNLDAETSKLLFWGILTDTGFFDFVKKHNADIFPLVETLFRNTDATSIEELKARFTLTEQTIDYVRLFHMNRTNVEDQTNGMPYAMYSFVDTEDRVDETQADLSIAQATFMTQLRKLERFQLFWTVTPTNRKNLFSISLRSKGDIDVATICQNLFNGGGHKNAAGGKIKLTADMREGLEKNRAANPKKGAVAFVAEYILHRLKHEVEWK